MRIWKVHLKITNQTISRHESCIEVMGALFFSNITVIVTELVAS